MVRALRVDGQAVGQGRELGSVVHGSTLSTIPHSASITLAAHGPATAIKIDAFIACHAKLPESQLYTSY
jgi:hypothetical protein